MAKEKHHRHDLISCQELEKAARLECCGKRLYRLPLPSSLRSRVTTLNFHFFSDIKFDFTESGRKASNTVFNPISIFIKLLSARGEYFYHSLADRRKSFSSHRTFPAWKNMRGLEILLRQRVHRAETGNSANDVLLSCCRFNQFTSDTRCRRNGLC